MTQALPTRHVAALRIVLAALLLLLPAAPAHADGASPLPQPSSPGSNAIGACTAAGQVWLYVEDVDGTVVANQCVGTPATGEDALLRAGVAIEHARSGLICTLAGRPARCPAPFDGSFWNYWHTRPGAEWKFSDKGAAEWHPQAGSIEAWCRNRPDVHRCEPPDLKVVVAGAGQRPPHTDEASLVEPPLVLSAPVRAAPAVPVATVISVVTVIALGVLVVVVVRRRSQHPDGKGPVSRGLPSR